MANVPEHPLRVLVHVPHGKGSWDRSRNGCGGLRDETLGLGSDTLTRLAYFMNSLGNETRDYSRGLIPRKIDLLRRGDVPLRGGVFGVQKTPSHKP